MKPNRLSVIIPAFNEENYIGACLQSIQKQTQKPLEVIVVNNNSTDRTSKIASQFNVRIVNEKKKGVSAARNAGAKMATGNILVFLDADCQMPPTHLQSLVNDFKSNKPIDGLAGPYVIHDGGKFVEWITKRGHYFWHYFRFINFLFGYQGFSGGNVAMKKSSFIAAGGFDETLHDILQTEDAEFAIRLHRLGFHIFFDQNLTVLSSFRRIKRAPVKTTILRMLNVFRHTRRTNVIT